MPKKSLKVSNAEPDFTQLVAGEAGFMSKYYEANRYIRTELTNKDMKTAAIKWLKKNKYEDVDKISGLPDWKFMIIGRLCYVLNNGGDIPETGPAFIENTYQELLAEAPEVEKESKITIVEIDGVETVIVKKNIQERMRDKVCEVIEPFENLVDDILRGKEVDLKSFNPLSEMRKADLKQNHSHMVVKYYQPQADELQEYIDKKDPDLTEAYSSLSKLQIKQLMSIYETILDASRMVIDSKKAERPKKIKKKKVINRNKMVAGIKFLKEDASLGIVSNNPIDILGAKTVWTYNVKSRKLSVYNAIDEAGITAKGAQLENYSKTTSLQKTLRKPDEVLKVIKKATAKSIQKEFDALSTVDSQVKPRLGPDVLIVRVFR